MCANSDFISRSRTSAIAARINGCQSHRCRARTQVQSTCTFCTFQVKSICTCTMSKYLYLYLYSTCTCTCTSEQVLLLVLVRSTCTWMSRQILLFRKRPRICGDHPLTSTSNYCDYLSSPRDGKSLERASSTVLIGRCADDSSF